MYGPPSSTPSQTPSAAWSSQDRTASSYGPPSSAPTTTAAGPPSASLPSAAAGGPGPLSPSPSSTAALAAPVAGQRVDASALVDALRTGAALQQGVATHGATRPGELVQLLSAAVDGGGQDAGGAAGEALAGAALGALAPAADVAPSLLSTTAAQRTTSSSSDTLLLLTMAGSALALLATGLESARRQRVRAAVARGRGRRALR